MTKKQRLPLIAGHFIAGIAILLSIPFAVAKPEYSGFDELLLLSLDDLINVQITVASKQPENTTLAPSSVTVFTRQEFTRMGVRTVEELLNYVPGFSLQRSQEIAGSPLSISTRGRHAGENAPDILFLIDGQRLNIETYGGAIWRGASYSLHNVKQVEVIRGPGSALYGSNAFSGIVNIITDPNLNEAYLAKGNFGASEAYLNRSTTFHDDWTASLSVRDYQDEGDTYPNLYDGGLHTPDDTQDPLHHQDIYLSLSKHQFTLNGRYSERRSSDFLAGNGIDNSLNDRRSSMLQARANYTFVESSKLNIKAYLSYSEAQDSNQIGTTGPGVAQALGLITGTDKLVFRFDSDNVEYSAGLIGDITLNEEHQLSYGIEWRKAGPQESNTFGNADPLEILNLVIESAAGGSPSPITVSPELTFIGKDQLEEKRTISSLYLQDSWQPLAALKLTAGLRYDNYSDIGDNINPRAAAVISLNPQDTVKILYGSAFRAPTNFELTGLEPTFVPDPQLKAEEIRTYEAAWIHTFDNWKSSLTYFNNTISNRIDTQITPVAFFFIETVGNFGTQNFSGTELEVQGSLSKYLLLRANYSHINVQESELQDAPLQTASVNLAYQNKQLKFNLDGQYHDDEQSRAGGTIKNYWLFNAKASYQLNSQLQLTAIVFNAFDRQYRTQTTAFGFPNGIPARGRNGLIGLHYEF
jgi:outer membrane receptor protein involved in Fe transport